MKSFQTYCPVFYGFYNTIWEPDTEINEYLYEENIEYEQITFNNKEYQNDVSKAVCGVLKTELSDFVTDIKFQELISPRSYNYSNDSINVEIELSEHNIKQIQSFIYENKSEFKKFLKERYTSRSGFISSHSNEFETWSIQTDDFTNFENNDHWLGSTLEFICQVNEINQETLYYGVNKAGVHAVLYCSKRKEEE